MLVINQDNLRIPGVYNIPLMSQEFAKWNIIPVDPKYNNAIQAAGLTTEGALFWHIPSKVLLGNQGLEVRYFGIVAQFTQGGYVDVWQTTTVDHVSHPHFASFYRGEMNRFTSMCLGSFRGALNAYAREKCYAELAYTLFWACNHVNYQSLYSEPPEMVTCRHCGTRSLQNHLLSANGRRACTHCDVIFGSGWMHTRLFDGTNHFEGCYSRYLPIWSDPWGGRLGDGYNMFHNKADDI